MNQHTNGPWNLDHNGGTAIFGPDGIGVIGSGVFLHRPHPEAWANLRLAAAAPDLLDALSNLLNCVDGQHDYEWLARCKRAALIAIAKATAEGK